MYLPHAPYTDASAFHIQEPTQEPDHPPVTWLDRVISLFHRTATHTRMQIFLPFKGQVMLTGRLVGYTSVVIGDDDLARIHKAQRHLLRHPHAEQTALPFQHLDFGIAIDDAKLIVSETDIWFTASERGNYLSRITTSPIPIVDLELAFAKAQQRRPS